ncbi:unnamed protein product [Closterium sp. NIES-65]|nr:unnamed protein product [Closterium sp. NIES-65]
MVNRMLIIAPPFPVSSRPSLHSLPPLPPCHTLQPLPHSPSPPPASASMVNRVRWAPDPSSPASRLIMSETTLKSAVEVPVPFRMIPRDVIETAGNKLLEQILKVAVPRFLEQGTPRCFPSSPYPLTPSLLALPHLSLLSVPSSPQLKKDYEAWASGDTSRKPLGTGEL